MLLWSFVTERPTVATAATAATGTGSHKQPKAGTGCYSSATAGTATGSRKQPQLAIATTVTAAPDSYNQSSHRSHRQSQQPQQPREPQQPRQAQHPEQSQAAALSHGQSQAATGSYHSSDSEPQQQLQTATADTAATAATGSDRRHSSSRRSSHGQPQQQQAGTGSLAHQNPPKSENSKCHNFGRRNMHGSNISTLHNCSVIFTILTNSHFKTYTY